LITDMHHPDTVEGGVEAFAAMHAALGRLEYTMKHLAEAEAERDELRAAIGDVLHQIAYPTEAAASVLSIIAEDLEAALANEGDTDGQ
jgi:hypothetical protein